MAKSGEVLFNTDESPGETYESPRIQAIVLRKVIAAMIAVLLLRRTLLEKERRIPAAIRYLSAIKKNGDE